MRGQVVRIEFLVDATQVEAFFASMPRIPDGVIEEPYVSEPEEY